MDPVQTGKVIVNRKQVFAYLLTVSICVWCLLAINRVFGVSFLAALLLAPAVSFGVMKASRLSVAVALSQGAVHKGGHVEMTVTVESRGLLPVPFIYIGLTRGWALSGPDGGPYVVSASKGKPGVIRRSYRAEIWGSVPLGVSAIVIHDFLGLFKLTGETRPFAKTVSVYPAIVEPQKNDVLDYICNAMLGDEEEEQQGERQNGLTKPGYTFRPYLPGDPLKRINWKLLAKHDRYMVRENEPVKNWDFFLLLDCRGAHELWEERMVEAVLAMLTSMVRQNISCKVYYFQEGAWRDFSVENEDQIVSLQHAFLTYTFTGGAPRIPAELLAGGDLPALFTCMPDSGLYAELSNLQAGEPIVICPEELARRDGALSWDENIWVVNETYDFYAL